MLGVPTASRDDAALKDVFVADLLTSFGNTGDYNTFSGASMRGQEGAWTGYRHTSDNGQAIVFYGTRLYYVRINGSSVSVWVIIG